MDQKRRTAVNLPENETLPAVPAAARGAHYVLRLYVTGNGPHSRCAIRNVRKLCDTYLEGRFDLAVIDIYQQPALACHAQLIAAPTLVKEHPLPPRRFIGTLANMDQIVIALGLWPDKPTGTPRR